MHRYVSRVATSACLLSSRRLCSSSSTTTAAAPPSGSSSSTTPSSNPFASKLAVRSSIFSGSAAPPQGVAPRSDKEEALVKEWRTSPHNAAGAELDVVAEFGETFRDTRARDPSESDEDMRRRLIYQSRYRGMVEMDLIFGHFARVKLPTLATARLREYDALLQQLDNDLFNWLVMGLPAPSEIAEMPCFTEVRNFVEKERHELLSSI